MILEESYNKKDFNRRLKALKEEKEQTIEFDQEIVDAVQLTSLVSSLIKDEFEAIDGYNGAIIAVSNLENSQNMINIFNDIIAEEYVHIGQLERILKEMIPAADNNLDKGNEEAEEVFDKEQPEVEIENESLIESDNEITHYEDIMPSDKNENVQNWYRSIYKFDDLADEINPDITFEDVYNAMLNDEDIYKVLDVSDSIVRERIMGALASLFTNNYYDAIYRLWLYGPESEEYKQAKLEAEEN